MDCSLPGSPVHGIFQARVLEWSAIAFSIAFYTVIYTYIPSLLNFLPIQVPAAAAAAAKLLQSCPTLRDPIDGSPPGSPVPGILQARTLE